MPKGLLGHPRSPFVHCFIPTRLGGGELLVAYPKLLGDVVWECLTIDDDVHRLALHEVLGGIPYPLVLTRLTSGILYEEELTSDLVLGHAEDYHAVVIGELIVVIALLTILLRGVDLGDVRTIDHLSDVVLLLPIAETYPASLVRSLGLDLLDIGEDG